MNSKTLPLRDGVARRQKEFLVTRPKHQFTCMKSSHEGYLTEDCEHPDCVVRYVHES